MSIKPLSLPRAKGPEIERAFQQIRSFADAVSRVPILQGVLVEGQELGSGDNLIAHSLGRLPRGWIVVKQNASATFYAKGSPNPDRFLNLNASAAVTASFWIF